MGLGSDFQSHSSRVPSKPYAICGRNLKRHEGNEKKKKRKIEKYPLWPGLPQEGLKAVKLCSLMWLLAQKTLYRRKKRWGIFVHVVLAQKRHPEVKKRLDNFNDVGVPVGDLFI